MFHFGKKMNSSPKMRLQFLDWQYQNNESTFLKNEFFILTRAISAKCFFSGIWPARSPVPRCWPRPHWGWVVESSDRRLLPWPTVWTRRLRSHTRATTTRSAIDDAVLGRCRESDVWITFPCWFGWRQLGRRRLLPASYSPISAGVVNRHNTLYRSEIFQSAIYVNAEQFRIDRRLYPPANTFLQLMASSMKRVSARPLGL